MSPARACLCLLFGLPAAGKSRLAEQLRGHAHSRGWRTLTVTYDLLIPERDWREEADRQICASSVLHQADQTCRRVVSQTIKTARERQASPAELQLLSAELNRLKCVFLQELRRAVLQSPHTHTPAHVQAQFEQRIHRCLNTGRTDPGPAMRTVLVSEARGALSRADEEHTLTNTSTS